jgi:hypothetical protein
VETLNYRGVVPLLVPLEPLVLLLPLEPLEPLELLPLEPGRCDDDPLGEELDEPGVVLELPGVLRLVP